jgi:acetoin utilization deacetylase AcuC-like enzyme
MKFVYHPRCLEHVQWEGHPERPERVEAIVKRLKAQEPASAFVEPRPATKREIVRVHDEFFVEKMRNRKEGPLDADTFFHKGTYALALLSAGAALTATRHALQHNEEAFALTRPPGHHAGINFAGGFCYFNNVAVAADFLSREEGLSPVAILDFDVHHGNGTQAIFERRKDIVYVSTHQDGIFPMTGAAEETGIGDGAGRVVNVPLPEGSGDATFDMAWDKLILPVLEAARPKAVLVSLGFDAHYADPIAGLSLSSPAYIGLAVKAALFAREQVKRPAVFALEGGYDLAALSECVGGISLALRDEEAPTALNDVRDTGGVGAKAVQRAAKIQSAHWGIEA